MARADLACREAQGHFFCFKFVFRPVGHVELGLESPRLRIVFPKPDFQVVQKKSICPCTRSRPQPTLATSTRYLRRPRTPAPAQRLPWGIWAPESMEEGIHLNIASNVRHALSFSVPISDGPGHAATDDEPSAHVQCLPVELPPAPSSES